MKSLILAATLAAAFTANVSQAADTAKYQIEFNATWTSDSHPLDYPSNAHFSGLIGATHGKSYTLFKDGGKATAGLEMLSEKGAHSPLDSEIKAAVASGKAGALFESGPLFSFPGKISATFTIDAEHPYVSAVAMVAPSPDWFTGVSKVSLRKDGNWVERATYTLFAWDAGTDSGTTYQSPDADTMPRQSIRMNAAPQFKGEDGLKPVGTVTFTRIKRTASTAFRRHR